MQLLLRLNLRLSLRVVRRLITCDLRSHPAAGVRAEELGEIRVTRGECYTER